MALFHKFLNEIFLEINTRMDILKLYIPIAPFLGKILLELFQRDVVTGNFGPVGELLVTETEHNSSEIVLLRFLQG